MCGIFCAASRHGYVQPSGPLLNLLEARGPDASNGIHLPQGSPGGAFLTMHSTVLSLRGAGVTSQPYSELGSSSMLCWNGEGWLIRGHRPAGNDTTEIFTLVQRAASQHLSGDDTNSKSTRAARNVAAAMAAVAGPYAFVFYDATHARLFFGRDFLGRRSLLQTSTPQGDVLLTSVTDGPRSNVWAEVEADGVYCLDLLPQSGSVHCVGENPSTWGKFEVVRVPYLHRHHEDDSSYSAIPLLSLNKHIPDASTTPLNIDSPAVVLLETLLREALALRVSSLPVPPKRDFIIPHLDSTKLAILFSGGLDCTTLARLAHDILPLSEPIDLLNVAFQNPRSHKTDEKSPYELCPDRITGRTSYAELCMLCPDRRWRFVAINIPHAEYVLHRNEVVRLMHPHNTEMDLSIASALYFAARGSGQLEAHTDSIVSTYETPARVLLSGLGADELFAGYTRHSTAFRRNGYGGLLEEMQLDVSRLGKRNLGRDDRVISHWGREVRFPFLDEAVVQWAVASPVTDKCDFATSDENFGGAHGATNGTLESSKKVLRCLAQRLGLQGVATEKKRAIQFGARTAKMESGKTKGTAIIT